MSKIQKTQRVLGAGGDYEDWPVEESPPEKTTTTLYQIQFRVKYDRTFNGPGTWRDIEHELWKPADWANKRLKYWQGLSLSQVLEFRVEKVERKLK